MCMRVCAGVCVSVRVHEWVCLWVGVMWWWFTNHVILAVVVCWYLLTQGESISYGLGAACGVVTKATIHHSCVALLMMSINVCECEVVSVTFILCMRVVHTLVWLFESGKFAILSTLFQSVLTWGKCYSGKLSWSLKIIYTESSLFIHCSLLFSDYVIFPWQDY